MKLITTEYSIVMRTYSSELGGEKASYVFLECSVCSDSFLTTVSSSKHFHTYVAMLLYHGTDAPSLSYFFSNRGSESNTIEIFNCLDLGFIYFITPSVRLGWSVTSKLNAAVVVVD